ncbi:MAG: cation-translocating P-type ATPase [Pseudomonadota bacterium]
MNRSPGHCDLCGLPLRYGVVEHKMADTRYRFCCTGCRQVFLMLCESADGGDPARFNESALFQKCLEMGLIPQSEAELSRKWEARPATLNLEPDPNTESFLPPQNVLHLRLVIGGMWCPVCAWAIEETLRKNSGIRNPVCLFSNDILTCYYNPVSTSPAAIVETIGKLGYRAHPPESDTARKEEKADFIRLCVAAFLSMNIMMLSFSLYFGFFQPFGTAELESLSWPVAVMATIVFFHGGRRIHRQAVLSLRTGLFGMETLISIGATSAYGYSLYNFLAGNPHLYFDTTAMLITLALLGKWLEGRARDRIVKHLGALFSLQPAKARICSPEAPNGRYVSAAFLKPGDTFRVEAGEIVPADGRISEGEGRIDESNITGEAMPRKKGRGDLLRSGTRVVEGKLRVIAQRVGVEGTLGQMISLIEKTLSQKTPIENLAHRYLRWFVPMIIGVAALTAVAYWHFGASVEIAVIRAITVLVVSCPCALGIAIPLARVAGISIAGAKGILVRSFSAFEKATTLHTVVFDKTGTVTEGHWTLKEILSNGPLDETFLLGIAAGLEAESNHAIGTQIRRLARERRVIPLPVQSINSFETGISGRYEGKKYGIGSLAFVQTVMSCKSNDTVSSGPEASNDASSRVYLGIEGEIAAVFILGDRIRPSAFFAIGALKRLGIGVMLVSGDDERVTAAVAEKLGIGTFLGGQSPAQKVSVVKKWQHQGKRVAMVGDGINDAPALAQSDLSVAIYSGNQLSEETTDISLMSGDLARLLAFFALAKRVRKKIRQNLLLAFIYNLVAIPIAIAGLFTPLVAVCAMLLSSLSVIGNTLLLIHFASKEPGLNQTTFPSPADERPG